MSRYNRSSIFALLLLELFSASLGFRLDPKPIAACKFEVNPHKKGSFPIVSTETGIIPPTYNYTDRSWRIEIPGNSTQELNLVCSGQDDQLGYLGTSYIAARCDDSGILQTEQGALTGDQLNCSVLATETITRNGKCFNNEHTNIQISFPGVSTPFIQICHDEVRSETLFTKHTINGPKLGEGETITTPGFKEAGFYPNIPVDKCYTQVEQIKTIAEILKSQSLADQYVQPSKSLYLARGHLTPNADGIPGDEKRATYYFVNVIPQWQIINAGNWLQLENKAREYARNKNTLLTVWTGTFGVSTLKDLNKNDKSIYLGKTTSSVLLNMLPVPRVTYKVIVDEEAKTGIVVLQINNPYEENRKAADIICPDICGEIPWVTWDVKNAQNGYTYCCDVSSFSKAMPGRLPSLGALGLLK